MGEAQKSELSAEQAIEVAFDLFRKYVERGNPLPNVLLEELEPLDGGWLVSIGFDGDRTEKSEPNRTGALAFLGSEVKTVTVREVRSFHLDADGNFQRMS
ncbi:MAG: hypothetical protein AAFY38_10205 [Pseudomonadota bacterium]